jgi:hypothetical protein
MIAVFINAFFDCFINALLEHELEVYDLGILNRRFGVEARIEVGVFRLPRAAEMARLRQAGRQEIRVYFEELEGIRDVVLEMERWRDVYRGGGERFRLS